MEFKELCNLSSTTEDWLKRFPGWSFEQAILNSFNDHYVSSNQRTKETKEQILLMVDRDLLNSSDRGKADRLRSGEAEQPLEQGKVNSWISGYYDN